jgi:hypothetical protein
MGNRIQILINRKLSKYVGINGIIEKYVKICTYDKICKNM